MRYLVVKNIFKNKTCHYIYDSSTERDLLVSDVLIDFEDECFRALVFSKLIYKEKKRIKEKLKVG